MSRTSVSVNTERALRDLSLTDYETMAYLSLLKSGELTANDVSSATTIPFSKVYTVLETLEKKGWVEVRVEGQDYITQDRARRRQEGANGRAPAITFATTKTGNACVRDY